MPHFPRRRAFGRHAVNDVARFLHVRGMRLQRGGDAPRDARVVGARYVVTRPTRAGYRWYMSFYDLDAVVTFIRRFFADVVPEAAPAPVDVAVPTATEVRATMDAVLSATPADPAGEGLEAAINRLSRWRFQ